MNNKKFRYCLNTSTIRCCGISLKEAVRITGEAGYEGIEPWVNEIDKYLSEGGKLPELKRMIKDAGLKAANLIGFFDWGVDDSVKREEAVKIARHAFELASGLDCPYVAAPPCGIHSTQMDLYTIAERYAALIDIGAEYGVIPVLEFWGFAKTLGHLGEALLVAAESHRTQACILADVFHMYKSSGTFEGLNLIGPKTIGIFHINDYPKAEHSEALKDKDRVYPGDGAAPLTQILKSLSTGGFSGMLSLELFNEQYWKEDPLVAAKTGLEKLRKVVEKV
jgi:sugar phosphate isomerase/epimerase